MAIQNRVLGRTSSALLLAAVVTHVPAHEPSIGKGMSTHEVRARLGAPERIGVLDGKLIETISEQDEARVTKRLVYYYRDGRLMIWFEHGKVTGVTGDDAAGDAKRDEN